MTLLNIIVNVLNYEIELLIKSRQTQHTFLGTTFVEHIYRRSYGIFFVWGRIQLFFTTPERTRPNVDALRKLHRNKFA